MCGAAATGEEDGREDGAQGGSGTTSIPRSRKIPPLLFIFFVACFDEIFGGENNLPSGIMSSHITLNVCRSSI